MLDSRQPVPVTFNALISTRREYDALASVYLPIAIGVFAIFTVLIVGSVLRYRRRPPEEASKAHENNPLETGYALMLTAVVAFLLYLTFHTEHRIDTVSLRQRPALTVDVTAAKWEWEFTYPAYGITHFSGTTGRQPLVVPQNEPIRFNLASQDVMHAFWVPELEFKRDLIPGAVERVVLAFTHTGLYRGQCAEFCGLRHPEMVFNVRVLSPSRFTAWARSRGTTGI